MRSFCRIFFQFIFATATNKTASYRTFIVIAATFVSDRNLNNAVQTRSLSPSSVCVCVIGLDWIGGTLALQCEDSGQPAENGRRYKSRRRTQTCKPAKQSNQRGPSVTRLSALASDEGEESTFVWHVCTRQEHCARFFSLQAHAEAAYLRLAELTKGGAVSDHRLLGQLFLGA